MKGANLSKHWPQVGHSQERHCENHQFKPKHRQSAGAAVCPECNAVWLAKHWYVNSKKAAMLAQDPLTRSELCPGCSQVKNQKFEGEVILKSPMLSERQDEVFGLLEHTEARAFIQNPRSRVGVIESTEDGLRLQTTTKWLAQRIGKEFAKAFHGSLELIPTNDGRHLRVEWQG